MTTPQRPVRARLIEAPDMPDEFEDLLEHNIEDLQNLPPRHHIPRFTEHYDVNIWFCVPCSYWKGLVLWPCVTAQKHGREVFEP